MNIYQYKNFIRSIIKKFTGSYDEDLEQEVYLKAWQNKDKYKEEGKPRQWLGVLTANLCRDYFKSRFFKENQNKIGADYVLANIVVANRQDERIDAKRRKKIILKAIDNLPKTLHKVVIWYEFENMSYAEIANKLNIPEGTVKSRLSNARKILSQQLQFLKENINE